MTNVSAFERNGREHHQTVRDLEIPARAHWAEGSANPLRWISSYAAGSRPHNQGGARSRATPQDNAGVAYFNPSDRHAHAENVLGTTGVAHRRVGSAEAMTANLAWWDADADDYHATHGEFLGEADFLWCPEGLREAEAGLLGDVTGSDVLEVGCGSAPCARWLTDRGARVTALDLSSGMLGYAAEANRRTGLHPGLVQANAEQLPFTDAAFDLACSAFGALPFVPHLDTVFAEVARVLRPGGRWVFSVTHPMRWIFPDDPGPTGLTVTHAYFDRTPYVEVDTDGTATYVEYHRTLGDYVRALTETGFRLTDLIEPEWPEGHTRTWGQWGPLRGAFFPGTAIFCCVLER